MLRLDDWSRLLEPAHRRSWRAAWESATPIPAARLTPFLDVLADPAVPRAARWIAAHALIPALRDDSGTTGERLAQWVLSLPAGRREEVLGPVLRAAGLRAGGDRSPLSPPPLLPVSAPPPPPADGAEAERAGDPSGLDAAVWVAFGLLIVDEVSQPTQRALAWILRRIRIWPPAVRLEARRLCALLALRRVQHHPSDDGNSADPGASCADLIRPWAENLQGADREEQREFEGRMLLARGHDLLELLDVLPQIRAFNPRCALRLFRLLVRRQASGGDNLISRLPSETFQAVFRRLLEEEGPAALQNVLAAYGEDLDQRGAEHEEAPSPWAASLDRPPEPERDLSGFFAPRTETPQGEGRRFPIAYHPDFAQWHRSRPGEAARRAGAGGFPLILEEVLAAWMQSGKTDRVHATLRCLLQENSLAPFWEAALHLLARFPRELTPTLQGLLADPGILTYIGLFGPCLAAVRACFALLSDRGRDAVERAVELFPEQLPNAPAVVARFTTWMAQAIAAAGVAERPRSRVLRDRLADPPFEPDIPTPAPLAREMVPTWSGADDAVPAFDQLSSRYGAPMRTLWQFARDHQGRAPTGAAAAAIVPLLADLVGRWAGFQNLWREILRSALTTALAAPAGSIPPAELATLRSILFTWAGRSEPEEILTRMCAASALEALVRHEAVAGESDPEARARLGKLVVDPVPQVRHAAAVALVRWEAPGEAESVARLWRAAASAAAESGEAHTLDLLLNGLCGRAAPARDEVFAVISTVLSEPERWHRPLREEELPQNGFGKTLRTDEWMGDPAARTAGKLLALLCVCGCEPACRRLNVTFAAASARVRLEQCLLAGVAAGLAEPWSIAPERRRALVAALLAAPGAPELAGAPDCVRRGMPDDADAALTLAERMLARAGLGLPPHEPAASAAPPRSPRPDLIHGAFGLLEPLWMRGAAAASAASRRRLLECADRLLGDPLYSLQVWERWLAATAPLTASV